MRLYKLIPTIFLAAFLTGCATTQPQVYLGDKVDLSELCARHSIQWKWDSISQIVTLSGSKKKVRVLVGSDVVILGGKKIVLSAPIIRQKNSIYVPTDFEQYVISVLKADKGTALQNRFKKIVIDPGHGGKDPGAISKSGFQEKKATLDISKRLKRKLQQQGIEVVLTRTTDKFLELGERTEVAVKEKADLFISVHANANHSRSVHGLEVYYFGSLLPEDYKEEQRLRNEWILFTAFDMQKTDDVKKIVRDVLDDYKKSVSKPLAEHISREMSGEIGAKNNGYMEARFHVLRNNFIPSILIEVGYLSHPREERLLKSPDYREKVARALAASILSYE